jgi:tetratricopeptide (TPR) repeat protein
MMAVALWQQFASHGSEPATREDLDAHTRKILEGLYDAARNAGGIPEQDLKAKDNEITRLTGELRKLQEELAARAGEPAEAQLSKLLAAGDLEAAFRVKSRQVERRQAESEKLPRDLYELGIICELRFDWPGALANFRKAWELGKNPEHGFKYAHFAQRLNHFNEAIGTFEALLEIYSDPSDRAGALNNLGMLYSDTQRMKEAEQAYAEALTIRRKLAEANPDAYLPDVATTLNNLAVLYGNTQRIKEAEQAYAEALTIRRKLAEANPDAYLPYVAIALNNLAYFHYSGGRLGEAGAQASKAEEILDPLWRANPELHGNLMAKTLWTRALISEASKRPVAEACALARRAFAAAYDPGVKESIQLLIDRLSSESKG